jgi:hypothetical protein
MNADMILLQEIEEDIPSEEARLWEILQTDEAVPKPKMGRGKKAG